LSPDPIGEANRNQMLAADPSRSVFVTANAGSGKTKVLVDRIARLLLEGARPSAFLCITFTKAAAGEMQRRLFDRLGAWCVADDAKLAAELRELGAGGTELSRARALFAQALETPGGLKIQTIHAFCERLLARFPLEAGVAPGFDIADEARAQALLSRARAETALASDAPRDAYQRFATRLDGESLMALLDRLALRRGDFRRFAARNQGELFAAGAIRARHGAREPRESVVRGFVESLDRAALAQAAAALAGGKASDQEAGRRLTALVEALDGAAERAVDKAFAVAFTDSGKGAARKQLVTQGVQKEHAWLEPWLQRLVDACGALRLTLNAIDRADDAAAALSLALRLDQAYGDAKAHAGALDFDDLIERAQALLERSEAAPWVLYKLDGGLDHILIDEGQDTSPAQWALIDPLQREFFAGHGARERVRTVFAVGDPKQSIYGFQGADPEGFLREARKLSQRAAAANSLFSKPELRTSFRSAPEVLRAVDATFVNGGLIESPPEAHDEIVHLASRSSHAGCVEVWPIAERPLRQEATPWDAPLDVEQGVSAHAMVAKALASHVKAMIAAREAVWDGGVTRGLLPKDVLVLVRTRGALFRELIKAFKRAGLPVAGADRMVLRDELAVEDCLALMRVALDPADDLALACVLKGPWCGLVDDDVDLFPLAYGRATGETLMSRLKAVQDPRYACVRAFVDAVCARRDEDPFAFLSWALETRHGGGPSGWSLVFQRLGLEARDPLEELLQRALKPARHAAATLQRFLADIENDAGEVRRELEAETGAVRVMTVHGAKGLEAPLVILPDATGAVSDAPEDGLLFDEEAGPFVSFRGRDDDPPTASVREAHQARALAEHWRLLYVAMTRARDRLIVCGAQFGNAKDGEAPESWRLRVNEALQAIGAVPCETPFGEGLRLGASLRAESSIATPKESATVPAWAHGAVASQALLAAAAPSQAAHAKALVFSPSGDDLKRFRRGVLIHGLLQRLPEAAPERRPAAAEAWLRRQGVGTEAIEALTAEALRVIDAPHFAAVFGPGSRAEAPIVGVVGGKRVRGVVDRLHVDKSRVLIVDFKTDRPAPRNPEAAPDEYVLQLALYRAVMAQIAPGAAIRCALLWTETAHLTALGEAQLDAALAGFLAS
jgi:ATP-dependent helicase/nuclease subunit A